MTTGEKLAACRRDKGWTQEQLAEKLQVSRQSVSRWEMDGAFPETETLVRLSRLFGCSIDYLLLEDAPGEGAEDVQSAFYFIRSCGFFFLATAARGVPRMRPMAFIALWQGQLLLSTDRRKNVYRELKENPEVELAAYHMDARKWIRIHGTLAEEESASAMQEMEALYPMIRQEYNGENRRQVAFFRLQAEEIRFM